MKRAEPPFIFLTTSYHVKPSHLYFLYFLYSDSIDHFNIGSANKPIRLNHHDSDSKGWTIRDGAGDFGLHSKIQNFQTQQDSRG